MPQKYHGAAKRKEEWEEPGWKMTRHYRRRFVQFKGWTWELTSTTGVSIGPMISYVGRCNPLCTPTITSLTVSYT